MNNIILLFGGNSCERDISIITAIQLYENIDRSKYMVYPVYFFEGSMYLVSDMTIDNFIEFKPSIKNEIFISKNNLMYLHRKYHRCISNIECIVVSMHGGNGENGEIQGYLDINAIPYTSCGVASSAIMMDKCLSKMIFTSLNIPQVDSVTIRDDEVINYENIVKNLDFPMVVKPASLGSSIGVAKVSNLDSLKDAIELAFYYDNKVLVEKGLNNITEYNIAVMRYHGEVIVSDIECSNNSKDILDFSEKYLENGKMGDVNIVNTLNLSESMQDDIKKYSMLVYTEFDMKGVIRIDYMVENNQLYLNEVNTIPGSFAYYLFRNKGINYSDLIDSMIDEAIKYMDKNSKLIKYYKSSVLKSAKYGINKLRK